MSTDWEGLDIPTDESDETEILVWEVDPHPCPRDGADVLWERSWQKMLDCVCGELESMLEQKDVDDLLDVGFSIKFRLRKMPLREWKEMQEGDEP